MDPKLKEILDNRPSVIRNSLFIRLLRLFARLVGPLLLIAGVVLIINAFVDGEIIKAIFGTKDYQKLLAVAGIIAIFLSFPIMFIVRLCNMLLDRNGFIWALELWRGTVEEEGGNCDYEKRIVLNIDF